MNCRSTLVDVAARAHCSKSTVSLALRNDPRIPQPTRERVQACARELSYRPDPALACIAAHRWRSRTTPSGSVVAFLTTNHSSNILLDAQALVGAAAQAEQLGYRLEHFRAEDYQTPAQMARVIQHRGIRGIIVGQLTREDYVFDFPWESFCAVACSTGFYKPPLHIVMPDHSHAVKRAFTVAHERGYQRIGLVLFDELNAIDDFDKVSAYLYCQSLLPNQSNRIPVAHCAPSDGAAFARWYGRHKPDCVLGLNPLVAWLLKANGVRIPQDVGFVSLMSSLELKPAGAAVNATLTTTDHCPELLGQTALEQLDVMLRANRMGPPIQPITMMIEAIWREGCTLPVRNDSPNTQLRSYRGPGEAQPKVELAGVDQATLSARAAR